MPEPGENRIDVGLQGDHVANCLGGRNAAWELRMDVEAGSALGGAGGIDRRDERDGLLGRGERRAVIGGRERDPASAAERSIDLSDGQAGGDNAVRACQRNDERTVAIRPRNRFEPPRMVEWQGVLVAGDEGEPVRVVVVEPDGRGLPVGGGGYGRGQGQSPVPRASLFAATEARTAASTRPGIGSS